MGAVDGWFEDAQARLMIECATQVLTADPTLPLVEIGSFRGRSTVVLASIAEQFGSRVYAIDPHRGDCGVDGKLSNGVDGKTGGESTFEEFTENIKSAGIAAYVEPIRSQAHLVKWKQPIGVLFIDGWHDYDSVHRDFAHFAPHVASNGVVLFHDYLPHPLWGVIQLVDELEADGWQRLGIAHGLVALTRETP